MEHRRNEHEIEPMTLGLVAGLGVGAGIFYYRSLVKAHLSRNLVPHTMIVHADVDKVMALANARESGQLADYLVGLLERLAGGGARIAAIPAFSPQVCARELAERTPLPLISLLDAIAEEIEGRGISRVAIFGTRVTMETNLFGRLRNIADVISPRQEEIEQISGIYGRIVKNESASSDELGTVQPGGQADPTREARCNRACRH